MTREAAGYPAVKEGLTLSSEIETAQQMVRALRPEAGIVIAISHAGEKVDEQIAEAVPGVDIIVGGHSHSRLPVGEFVKRSEDPGTRRADGTIIVQAYQWGGELGRLDLMFDKDERGAWRVDRYRARLIPVTSDIPEDKTTAAVVDRYWKPISARFGKVIGRAEGDFSDRGYDLAQYNLVADAIRETYGAHENVDTHCFFHLWWVSIF